MGVIISSCDAMRSAGRQAGALSCGRVVSGVSSRGRRVVVGTGSEEVTNERRAEGRKSSSRSRNRAEGTTESLKVLTREKLGDSLR